MRTHARVPRTTYHHQARRKDRVASERATYADVLMYSTHYENEYATRGIRQGTISKMVIVTQLLRYCDLAIIFFISEC